MSANKKVVGKYLDSLSRGDRPGVLSCLADDVERIEWADGFPESGVPHRGKAAFDQSITEPPGGWPLHFRTDRMTEENNVVVVEGTVRVPMKEGRFFYARFCSVFELEAGKVKRLDSWTAEDKESR